MNEKQAIIKKKVYILLLILSTGTCLAGNPMFRGTWKGYILSKSLDDDNKKGLPVTLYIVDDNDAGDLVGEMSIQYKYQTDIYKAKYKVSGSIDYDEYTMYIRQEKLVYYDLLPKGLQWCFGSGNYKIFRNSYKKKIYIDGYMTTDCGKEKIRMILIKK